MPSEPARLASLDELVPHVRDRFLMLQRDAFHLHQIRLLVTETRRTPERQDWLYGSGRPDFPVYGRPGRILTNLQGHDPEAHHVASHGKATALDYLVRWGTVPDWHLEQPWAAVGSLATALGFTWGGAWRSPWDLGHIQWPKGG